MRQLISARSERHAVVIGIALALTVILVATAFPRLMIIGGLPTTDEGFYAYQAQYIHAALANGHGLPDIGTLTLYPMSLSWIFELSGNSIILLRLVDLLVAALASGIFYLVIARESGSRLGAFVISWVFLFTMNQPAFIQTGFKNSIFAAYVPLFFAQIFAQNLIRTAGKSWELVGICVGLAVLLRETFLPFILIGTAAIWVAQGWRASLRFTLGAALTGIIVTLSLARARGGLATLIESYRDAGVVYSSIAYQRAQLFIDNGTLSAKQAAAALIVGGLSVLTIMIQRFRAHGSATWGKMAFWLAIALAPLIEPASKIGFPYHFAVCLPGLAGLSALGWKAVTEGCAKKIGMPIAFMVLIIIGMYQLPPKYVALSNGWPASKHALANIDKDWSAEAISQSNYLLAANVIRSISAPGATLSVSGFMYMLYPLSGLLPSSDELSNLSATLIKLDLDELRFKQALEANPPDTLMTTTRTDFPGAQIITKVVEESGMYEVAAAIPIAPEKSYGSFGGTIYKKISPPHENIASSADHPL